MLALTINLVAEDGYAMGGGVLAVSPQLAKLQLRAVAEVVSELERVTDESSAGPALPSLEWDDQPETRGGPLRLVAEYQVQGLMMEFEITEVPVL